MLSFSLRWLSARLFLWVIYFCSTLFSSLWAKDSSQEKPSKVAIHLAAKKELFEPLNKPQLLKFLFDDLKLSNWSYHGIAPVIEELADQDAHSFMTKQFLFEDQQVALFYKSASRGGIIGLSFSASDTDFVSIGAGFRQSIDSATQKRTSKKILSTGIFWERNNQPLLALTSSPLANELGCLSLYPGHFQIGPFAVGAMIGLRARGQIYGGLSATLSGQSKSQSHQLSDLKKALSRQI